MKKIKIKAQEFLFLALFCLFVNAFALPSPLSFPFLDGESVFSTPQDEVDTLEFNLALWEKNDSLIFAVIIGVPGGYYLYSNPKGPGVGKELQINLDENAPVLFAKQSPPQKFFPPNESAENWLWAWKNEAIIFIGFSGADFSSPLEIELNGAYCLSLCIPFSRRLKISREAAAFDENLKNAFVNAIHFPLNQGETAEFAEFNVRLAQQDFSLFSAIFFAFLAGIILNFMPCVLPVLGIKILSFSQNRSKKTALLKSLAFSFGIIFVFLILAVIAVQARIWWGQQFQNPIFITVLAALMFLGALFLFDVFSLSPNSKVADLERKQDKNTFFGNFIRGICATVLATPCSGPLLGAVFAWALIDNTPNAVFAVFLAVGAGMSAPYIVLSVFGGAKISQKISKYSVLLKKILGIILLLFAGYLLFAAHSHRIFTAELSSNAEVGGVWQEFSPELFERARVSGQSVIVEFTARWCLNCQYNRIAVYETPEILSILKERDILALRADLTNQNISAQDLQRRLNSKSLPFMAIFDGGDFENPVIFRDLVGKRAVAEALENVR